MESMKTVSQSTAADATAKVDTDRQLVDRLDHELLARFQQSADADAFKVLVERHHGLVFAIARRMLGCPHAAEDVVQATFLVLARDARKIRKRHSLVSWLYGVAYRISARVARQRARNIVSTLEDEAMVAADPLESLNAQYEQEVVFEELHALPESVRAPLVMRYLNGKTNQQVAAEMNLSQSAVEGRLKRGRKQLRLRLARKGVTYGLGIGIMGLVQREALATDIPNLVSRTLATSLGSAITGESTVETGHTHEITRMAEEEIFKMATTKMMSMVAATGIAFGVIASGLALAGDAFNPANGVSGAAMNEVAIDSSQQETDPAVSLTTNSQEESSSEVDPAIGLGGGMGTAPPSANERRRNANHHSIESLSENELRILESLQKPGNFDHFELTLEDVAAEIAEDYQIQVVFDSAVADIGVEPATELVTIKVRDVALENALELMLSEKSLTAIIKNEVLFITTLDAALDYTTTRVYPCPHDWPIHNDEILEVIMKGVDPDSWEINGGTGTISIVTNGLVISATHDIHRQINNLFSQFHRIYDMPRQRP